MRGQAVRAIDLQFDLQYQPYVVAADQPARYLRMRDGRGDFDHLKTERGEWRPAGDPASMGALGSNAVAAVREGGGSLLHINPHVLIYPAMGRPSSPGVAACGRRTANHACTAEVG